MPSSCVTKAEARSLLASLPAGNQERGAALIQASQPKAVKLKTMLAASAATKRRPRDEATVLSCHRVYGFDLRVVGSTPGVQRASPPRGGDGLVSR